jgi:uncharacterized membrane protein
MKEWLAIITENAALIINAMALLVIAYGTIEAFFHAVRCLSGSSGTGQEFRHLYLRYARFLVGGLTFQLAADIIETAVTPGWEEIGRLAAVAAIRTFLNYFLERDMAEARDVAPVQAQESSPSNGQRVE